jgi:hypothetical protein
MPFISKNDFIAIRPGLRQDQRVLFPYGVSSQNSKNRCISFNLNDILWRVQVVK